MESDDHSDELIQTKGEVDDDSPISFRCPALEGAVREELEKPEGDITHRDLASVDELDWSFSWEITDLSGLEHATNLEGLRLDDNQITDVTPLAGLSKLTELALNLNQITDVTPLAGLTNLTELTLPGNNGITDVTPLAGLTKLKELGLPKKDNPLPSAQIEMLKKALPKNCRIWFSH